MNLILILALIALLFLLIGLSEPLAARLRVPFSVILAGLGVVIGLGASWSLRTDLTDALNPVANAILQLPITANVFLYLFLPTLLFQATLGMNIRRMADDWVPILVLAVIAVVVATMAVGYALYWASPLPLMACLLIGAIVSTTDPSAVVGIFRNIAAPQRLSRIVEGESLLNDAAAIALFGLFVTYVMRGVPNPDLPQSLLGFPVLLAGGALTGWLLARAAAMLMRWLSRFVLAQMSVSVALPYLAYILAEQFVGASGVIAVVAAGMTLNLVGPGRLSPAAWVKLRDVWDLLAYWAGAFIFVLAALLIPRLLDNVRLADLGLLAVVTGAAIGARVLILFGLFPVLTFLKLSSPIETPYRIAILWGGLRGAVTLSLALAVTENLFVAPEVRRLVAILSTGFVLFTLIVQGTTLRWIINRLGLARLTPLDAALANQVIAVALQSVRETVAQTTENYGLTREIVRSEAKSFAERMDGAVKAAEESEELLDRDRITLGLIALAGHERDMILERMRERAISGRIAEIALANADRLIEMTRVNGRTGYRRGARAAMGPHGLQRAAVRLHNMIGLSRPLERLTADRFELLLMQRLSLRDMHGFIDGRIRRIHARRVADLLHELLERRGEEVEQALEGLRLQYPGYAERLERRFIRSTALRIEEREYDALRDEGLIGAEVHATLLGDIETRRADAQMRPKLDLALQKADLIGQFPIFADLDDKGREALARRLTTRFVAPGDVILPRNTVPSSVFFIASGAVELDGGPHQVRLGRGEMFGQLALLSRRPRRGEVKAISHGVLLALDEARFMRLMKRSPALRDAVRDSAIRRGVPPEVLAGLDVA
ncbi:MAG: cation:proton antiporter [Rubellimicrobium sp.]|nr:cation:proton antiporter [Rubellimicrobium sp.]